MDAGRSKTDMISWLMSRSKRRTVFFTPTNCRRVSEELH